MKIVKLGALALSVIFMSGCDLQDLKDMLSNANKDYIPKIDIQKAISKGFVAGYDSQESLDRQLEAIINYVRSSSITCNDEEALSGPSAEIYVNEKLKDSAKEHSDDMLNTGNFSHKGSDGSNSYERMQRHGYKGRKYSENIYYEHNSAGVDNKAWIRSIEAWISSTTGHCSNLMDPDITDFGFYESKNSTNTTSYITLDLGEKN